LAADERTLFLTENAERFHLREIRSEVDFAAFTPPGGGNFFGLTPESGSQRLLAWANSRALTFLDLGELRRELATMGLDWSGENPATRFVPPVTESNVQPPTFKVQLTTFNGERSMFSAGGWVALGGVLAAIGLGVFLLRYQRAMVRRYADAEELVRQRETEIDQARREGLQGQKMQALGLLAGGVSHEFKNLLSTISLSNDLIRRELGPDSEVREEVENIDHAVEQGRAVVNSLLGYGRPRDVEDPACDPVDVIHSTLKLLNREFLGDVLVVFRPPSAPPRLQINPARLEQALVNLCLNAVEAMNRKGELRIELRDGVSVNTDAAWALRPPSAHHAMTVAVCDTGCGMEPAILERIFEPFFTTKAAGETPLMADDTAGKLHRSGSGLGLTTVYRLAEKSGAGLAVWSRVGRGSVFYLVVPAQSGSQLGVTRPVGDSDAP
jgi:signal transduction histidine kinase